MPRGKLTDTEDNQENLGGQMKKIAEALDRQKRQSLDDAEQTGRNSESRSPRQGRDADTREASATPQSWKPADVLPDPPHRDGYVHRWVRGSSRGQLDGVNMAKAMREGWRPCSASDYPEITVAMYNSGESTDTIEFGGLILCRMPVETDKARKAYHENLSMRQINSVNQRLREEQAQDNRVKYHNEGSSLVNNLPPR